MDVLSSLIQCLEQASLEDLQTEVDFAGTILSSITAHLKSRLQDRPRESVIRKEDYMKKASTLGPKKKFVKEIQIFQENRQETKHNLNKEEQLNDSQYSDKQKRENWAPQAQSVIKFGIEIENVRNTSLYASSKLDIQFKKEKETLERPLDLDGSNNTGNITEQNIENMLVNDKRFLDLLTPEATAIEWEDYEDTQEVDEKYNLKVEIPTENDLVEDKTTVLSSEEQLYIENSLKNAHQLAMYAPQVLGKIVLPCQLCEFKTQSTVNPMSELRLHMVEVHFLCALCGAKYEKKSDLGKHFEYLHKRNSKYFACGISECKYKVFQDCRLRKMYYHIRNEHTNILSACRVCQKTFKVWRSLKIHEFNKHNLGRELEHDQLKMCLECGHMATRTNMVAHTRNVHSVLPVMKCSKCHYETRKGEERMERHEKMHLVEKMKCGLCNFTSRVYETLEKHRTKIHEKGGLLMCTSCNYKTGMMKHLRRHEQTHSKDTPYACDKCDYKAKTDYSLKAHSFYHQDPKFLCDKCDYKSCSSGNLHSHKMVKHSTLKYECEQCGKLFNYKRHLLRHQANHEDGNMPCSECDQKFHRKDKLNDHLRYVHQKPAIEATQLVSKFEDPPSLQNTNENIETILRNHSCAQCPKTFTCSKHLSRHKNSVHSAVELTCQFCQKIFSRKDKLNVHINFSCKLKI